MRRYINEVQKQTAMDEKLQERLARVLAEVVYAWVIGDPMYSGENQSFVDDLKFLAAYVPAIHRRKLRLLYRGVRVDTVPADWTDQSATTAVTSLKPLQSWSGKLSIARQFTDPNQQHWTKGKHGALFTARASTLPILFTIIDLKDCYFDLVEQLPYKLKDAYTSMSHSEFLGTYYELERYAKQDEVIVLADAGARLPILKVAVV